MLSQRGDVFGMFAQWRNDDGNNVEAVMRDGVRVAGSPGGPAICFCGAEIIVTARETLQTFFICDPPTR